MITYILEVIVFQAIFLGFYLVFFRKESFFSWNRMYLLATFLISFILPFAEFAAFKTTVGMPEQLQQLNPAIIGDSMQGVQDQSVTSGSEINWWLVIYSVGFIFSLGILFRKYQEVSQYFRFQQKENTAFISIPNSREAFTFLNRIFIGEKIDLQTQNYILAHEEEHVRQHHGLDLLFFEILRVIFWFNPLIYAYQKTIAEVHEYLADRQAIQKIKPKAYYNELLNTAFGTQRISFTNTFFNHSLIKKRIIMLHKQSKTTAKLKYLVLLPVLAGMLTYVGCSSDNELEKEKSGHTIEQQIADLKATIDAEGELSPENQKKLAQLVDKKPSASVDAMSDSSKDENTDIPFAVIEEVPTYPGCEGLADNQSKKDCMSEKITAFTAKNFDTSLGKKLELTGINRVYVQFKINAEGNVEFMRSRGPHPALEEEAKRVINLLPKMKPGVQRGQNVGVLYALPIVFQVAQ